MSKALKGFGNIAPYRIRKDTAKQQVPPTTIDVDTLIPPPKVPFDYAKATRVFLDSIGYSKPGATYGDHEAR